MRDYGEGIPPEVLEHIFDRFYRGEERATILGFGLGLPIAKFLVESMGGTTSIESQLRQGSDVSMSFPFLEKLPQK